MSSEAHAETPAEAEARGPEPTVGEGSGSRWTDLGPILPAQTADTLEDALSALSEFKKTGDEDRMLCALTSPRVLHIACLCF
jgi:hypothetical protein